MPIYQSTLPRVWYTVRNQNGCCMGSSAGRHSALVAAGLLWTGSVHLESRRPHTCRLVMELRSSRALGTGTGRRRRAPRARRRRRRPPRRLPAPRGTCFGSSRRWRGGRSRSHASSGTSWPAGGRSCGMARRSVRHAVGPTPHLHMYLDCWLVVGFGVCAPGAWSFTACFRAVVGTGALTLLYQARVRIAYGPFKA